MLFERDSPHRLTFFFELTTQLLICLLTECDNKEFATSSNFLVELQRSTGLLWHGNFSISELHNLRRLSHADHYLSEPEGPLIFCLCLLDRGKYI